MVSATDELIPFIDNGGRRSYIGRRRYSNLYPIPDRRKANKDRRTNGDRRKTLNTKRIKGWERRHYFKD